MRLEVLISCMHQENGMELIERSGITGNVLMVNQTDREQRSSIAQNNRKIRIIDTTERGLSNSRNMAIRHAEGDICLLCDDDERFEPNYESVILQAFARFPKADIIAFRVMGQETRLKKKSQPVGCLKSLRLVSYQLAFRRSRILEAGISFDPYMGAGSGNGAGEENKFLLDCLKNGLKIWYVPQTIAQVNHGPSTWFSGYDQNFFIQRGSATRYMLGLVPAFFYGIYYVLFKRKLYRETITTGQALAALLSGIWQNRIKKCISEK